MKRYILSALFVTTFIQLYPQTNQKTGSISDVAFIAGSWKATPADRTVEAAWSEPVGGNMTGYVRVMKEGKIVLYELFGFEETEAGLVALVRHFRPGLIASEEKENPNRYQFLEASDGKAVFEKQGEPTRVLYEKRSNDQFAIVIGKQENSQWVFKDFWVFSRVK